MKPHRSLVAASVLTGLTALSALTGCDSTKTAAATPTPTASTTGASAAASPSTHESADLDTQFQQMLQNENVTGSSALWDKTGSGPTTFALTGADVHRVNVALTCTNGPTSKTRVTVTTAGSSKPVLIGGPQGCANASAYSATYGIGSPALSLHGSHTFTVKLPTGPNVQWQMAVALTSS